MNFPPSLQLTWTYDNGWQGESRWMATNQDGWQIRSDPKPGQNESLSACGRSVPIAKVKYRVPKMKPGLRNQDGWQRSDPIPYLDNWVLINDPIRSKISNTYNKYISNGYWIRFKYWYYQYYQCRQIYLANHAPIQFGHPSNHARTRHRLPQDKRWLH